MMAKNIKMNNYIEQNGKYRIVDEMNFIMVKRK